MKLGASLEDIAELQLQVDVFRWLAETDPPAFVFHVPNSQKRSRREAVRVRAMGIKAGVADLAVMLPGGRQGWIELKTRSGKLSHHQSDFAMTCWALGHRHRVCRSVAEVAETIELWIALPSGVPVDGVEIAAECRVP